MKINAAKHKSTFSQQAHLNSNAPPPAGNWQAVVRAIGERRAVGSGHVTTLHIALGQPLKVDEEHAQRADAIAGKARIRVDLWHPTGPDDAAAEQRWGWLALACGAEDLDMSTDDGIAAALVGNPFLAEFVHVQRKGSTYLDTRLVRVAPCSPDVASKVRALCASHLGGDKVLRAKARTEKQEHASTGEDPFGDFSLGGME